MSTRKFLSWILLFALTTGARKMNAQINSTKNELTAAQGKLVTISALTATGDMDQLQVQLNEGLAAGLSVNEIKEALVQLYAYCGFPRSLNAINTFKSELEKRKAKGIIDLEGKPITLGKSSGDRYEKGRKVLETLTGTPQAKPAPGFGEFAPRIDAFLKEHLFADVFDSDVLTYQQRELVTIAALASMPGVQSQLQAHVQIGKHIGLTDSQLDNIATLIERHISRTQANTVRLAISKPVVEIVESDMMVRISEIEIVPEFLAEYKAILKEEAAASVNIEAGVIAIFPMYQKENPTQVRIIEIYSNRAAYQSHLKTPHFLHYKTSTLKMVKALKLVDMNDVDSEAMQLIFAKLK